MSDKLIRLAERRNRLIAQAAEQRLELAQNIEPWRRPLARADLGLHLLHLMMSRPAWIVSGGVILTTMKFDRAGKWLRRGWIAWQIMQALRRRSQEQPPRPD